MGRTTKLLAAGGVTAAIAAGGVALADASSGGTRVTTTAPAQQRLQSQPPGAQPTGARAMRRGRFGALRSRRLTNGELHLFVRGQSVTVRVDRGVLRSIGNDSIVLHELGGSDVTIPVDAHTRVRRMGSLAKLSDLRVGDVAFALRRGGGAAKLVRSPGHPPRRLR